MPPERPELTVAQAGLLATAAAGVGLALQIRNGTYDPSAMALVVLALGCALAVVLDTRVAADLRERALVALLAALSLGQIALLALQPVGIDVEGSQLTLKLLLTAAAAAVVAIAAGAPRRWCVPALLAVHFAAGVWILRHAVPATDVFNFQRASLEALRNGVDPYAIKFRNIYHPYEGFYGPGLVKKGILQFGYPYPPLPLFLTAPGLVFGDIRYAHLTALTLAGAAIAYARPGRVAPLAATLLLFSPRVGLLLQMSWTEPFAIFFLAATALCAVRWPRLLPLALGLFLATKQYLVFFAPAAWLLVAHGDRRRHTLLLFGKAVAIAVAITLPLALWNVGAFVRSAVTLQFHQPFRADALSLLVTLARAGGAIAPRLSWLALVLCPAALALGMRRCPRTPAGFGAAVSLAALVLFAFNKQAFCNYYFFAIGALAVAVGSRAPVPAERLVHHPAGASGADAG